MEIWLLLALAITVVLVAILWLRLHPFLALLLAGWIVATGTSATNLRTHATALVKQELLTAEEVHEYVQRPPTKRLLEAFGQTAGQIGVLIALASILGACLAASGAAQRIVAAVLALIGERQAPLALASSSFLLGIPIYFDTVFYLMVPLARSLRARSGRNYVFYILAIMAGGSIAHSLIPPTPGPLQVAEIIGVELITLILVGTIVGALSSGGALLAAWWLNRRIDVPLRPLGHEEQREGELTMEAWLSDDTRRMPLLLALLPIVLPLLLIGFHELSKQGIGPELLQNFLSVCGEKNIAVGIGAMIAMGLLRWAPPETQSTRVIGEAISSAGVIILITSSGGAFGAMLGQSGMAERLTDIQSSLPGLMLLVIAFLLTAAIRTLQGSATVAMITAAGILQGLANTDTLPFHPVYLVLAIGGGSKPISWMNDSGFWVMCKMSGMTESEGLRTISPLTIAMGLSTLFWTLLAAWLVPLKS